MKLDALKTISDIVSAWVGLAAIVFGGSFAAYQYLEKESDDRVKATLELLDRYQKPPFIDSRLRIEAAWQKYDTEYNAAISITPFKPAPFNQLVWRVTTDEKIFSDLQLLLGYFETVEICVRRAICDAPSAVSFLQRDARSLYNLHYAVIDAERSKRSDPSFASAVESFTRRPSPK